MDRPVYQICHGWCNLHWLHTPFCIDKLGVHQLTIDPFVLARVLLGNP